MISLIEIRIGNNDTVELTISDESGDRIVSGLTATYIVAELERLIATTTHSAPSPVTPHIS